jgi:hypothetical protein
VLQEFLRFGGLTLAAFSSWPTCAASPIRSRFRSIRSQLRYSSHTPPSHLRLQFTAHSSLTLCRTGRRRRMSPSVAF